MQFSAFFSLSVLFLGNAFLTVKISRNDNVRLPRTPIPHSMFTQRRWMQLAMYWGQSDNQVRPSFYCQDNTIDMVHIDFLTKVLGTDDAPTLGLVKVSAFYPLFSSHSTLSHLLIRGCSATPSNSPVPYALNILAVIHDMIIFATFIF